MLVTRLFISHSSDDKAFVLRLSNDLKTFAGHVWVDIWELRVGDSLRQKLREAIHQNDFFAIVLSPKSVKSDWVKFELTEALIKELDDKKVFILPILYETCRRPKSIKEKIYADFREEYDLGLIDVLKAIVNDKNRLLQIENGFLGIHTDIPSVFLDRLQHTQSKLCLNAVFYPLFTFTAAIHDIQKGIEENDCNCEILFQNPSCKYIDYITSIVRHGYTSKDFVKELEIHINIFKALRDKYPRNIQLRLTDSFPTCPMVMMDNRVFVGFFTYTSPAPTGLWIELSKALPLSDQFIRHFQTIWDMAKPI